MLLVPTYVSASAIHGLGLFAAAPITKDTMVWCFDPNVDSLIAAPVVEWLPEAAQHFFSTYAYTVSAGVLLLCGDNARYMNHSETPNIQSAAGFAPDYAARDIAQGEELCTDYRLFEQGANLF